MLYQQSKGSFTKKEIARSLGFSRSSWYYQHSLDGQDKELSNKMLKLYEIDDTLGHRKLAVILSVNKKRIRRIMVKYDIRPRLKRRRYIYPGSTKNKVENMLLSAQEIEANRVIFSDIFQFRLKDSSKVYCCFIIRKITRQILSFCWSYEMRSNLTVESINKVDIEDIDNSRVIIHTDQGSQYGAKETVEEIVKKGFQRSMSRAGTPTDNPIAERFVGIFKLAVTERYKYRTIGDFIDFSNTWLNFYNKNRPHQSLGMKSPDQFATLLGIQNVSYFIVNRV